MKVVERFDGKFVYRSIPDFEVGNGILNAILLWGGIATDYQEVEITDVEWDAAILAGNVIGTE